MISGDWKTFYDLPIGPRLQARQSRSQNSQHLKPCSHSSGSFFCLLLEIYSWQTGEKPLRGGEGGNC